MFRSLLRTVSGICLVSVLVLWYSLGANLGWTKTSVAVPSIDAVTGIQYPVIEERFVPGVDFLGLGIAASAVLAALSYFPTRRKKHP